MLALTKKHPTERIELRFLGPPENRDKAIEALRSFGFVEESVSWQECIPGTEENLPGMALVGARTKEGLTQRELSRATGIPQRHISELENGKRTIGKDRARKLAEVLRVNYRIFL